LETRLSKAIAWQIKDFPCTIKKHKASWNLQELSIIATGKVSSWQLQLQKLHIPPVTLSAGRLNEILNLDTKKLPDEQYEPMLKAFELVSKNF
jgi:hypothetical protein